MTFTVIVCGGRTYDNAALVEKELDELSYINGPLTVVQGGASGADDLAKRWCYKQGPSTLYRMYNEPADWKAHGRAAGPKRNQRMLDEYRPDMVLAFPGGSGTADMIRRAKLFGVKVHAVCE